MNGMTPGAALRRLIKGREIVMAPGAMDSLTARLVERAGFPAVYMTGFGATASRLGMPDIGLLSQTEMTEHARNMTRAVSIPVIADADTGYGGPSNIHRTVREYVQAGVAAIHLEDQVAPKRCGQLAGIRLIDAARKRGAPALRRRGSRQRRHADHRTHRRDAGAGRGRGDPPGKALPGSRRRSGVRGRHQEDRGGRSGRQGDHRPQGRLHRRWQRDDCPDRLGLAGDGLRRRVLCRQRVCSPPSRRSATRWKS